MTSHTAPGAESDTEANDTPSPTNHQGRIADRVAAVTLHGAPLTDEQRAAATALVTDLLAAAAAHGVTLEDWDMVLDLPAGAVDVIRRIHR
ncbi:hypothetical protein ACIQU6_30700 [Streptomyces sp. NPDC090442]|uniref:hypothetical protein n=1 Tax=Streptomyces sp. NPDC090442 TaxID=3365962 RepID=UPI0037F39667